MGYCLQGHPGSGDHGCEDRVRGTCAALGDLEVRSARPGEDWRYGLGQAASLRRDDRRCPLTLTDGAGRRILWDWTGPAVPEGHDGITVPDRRSLATLERAGLKEKARLGPDPLFLVERQVQAGAFRQPVFGFAGWPALPWPWLEALVGSLLAQRPSLAMIPYRAKDAGLQRLLAKERPGVILRPDGPSPALRGDLSLCEGIIGSPAAVMAAWSCGVPGLCVGFAPRAVGLAEDLFGRWEDAVVPIASLRSAEDLILAARCFLSLMDGQRKVLEAAVPRRKARSAAWDPQMLGW